MKITTQTCLQIQCNSYQNTNVIFHKTRREYPTNFIETQKTPDSQRNLDIENGAGGIRLPDFRLYYKATVRKRVWYWLKNINIDKWYRRETWEISPCTYSSNLGQIYDKGGISLQRRNDNFFNKWCWESWRVTFKRIELTHSLTPCTTLNSKWIQDECNARHN